MSSNLPDYRDVIKLHEEGKYAEAEAMYRVLEPHSRSDAQFLMMFAQCLCAVHKFDEALERASLSLAIEPDNAEALVVKSAALGFLGRTEEAFEAARQAEYRGPTMPAAHWNYALALLHRGEFFPGFWHYEWGKVGGHRPTRHIRPEWDGSRMEPWQTLYVWAEQGLGDTIQFCRLLKEAKERSGARIVFECQHDLLPLLHGFPYADEVVMQQRHGNFGTPYTEHVALMSLPHVLGWKKPCDIPPFEPYIKAKDTADDQPGDFLRVGVVWQGSKNHAADSHRSIPYEKMASLFTVEGVGFTSLQYGVDLPDDSPLGTCTLRDFRDTAAVIAALDLVITVDTSVAHLAGAMGKPVWNLIAFDCDWRWMQDRTDSPWYPTMRLFRQQAWGDWEGVIEEVRKALEEQATEYGVVYPDVPSGFTAHITQPDELVRRWEGSDA